jgi:hypothetical protein
MQAIYSEDGTIRQVYDEALHSHDRLLTIDLTAEQAANIELYRVGPNTVELYLVPTCAEKYQKVVNKVILEMTQAEKDFVELPQRHKKLIDDELVEMSLAEKAQVDVTQKRFQIEADRDNQLLGRKATVVIDTVRYQADPRSMKQLNDALTTFSVIGSTPAGFEWRDAHNVNHPADLMFLATIAAARGEQVNIIWLNSWERKAALDAIDLTAADALAQIEAV